jgi:hypothetical protein
MEICQKGFGTCWKDYNLTRTCQKEQYLRSSRKTRLYFHNLGNETGLLPTAANKVLAKAGGEYQVEQTPSVARLRQYFSVRRNTRL